MDAGMRAAEPARQVHFTEQERIERWTDLATWLVGVLIVAAGVALSGVIQALIFGYDQVSALAVALFVTWFLVSLVIKRWLLPEWWWAAAPPVVLAVTVSVLLARHGAMSVWKACLTGMACGAALVAPFLWMLMMQRLDRIRHHWLV